MIKFKSKWSISIKKKKVSKHKHTHRDVNVQAVTSARWLLESLRRDAAAFFVLFFLSQQRRHQQPTVQLHMAALFDAPLCIISSPRFVVIGYDIWAISSVILLFDPHRFRNINFQQANKCEATCSVCVLVLVSFKSFGLLLMQIRKEKKICMFILFSSEAAWGEAVEEFCNNHNTGEQRNNCPRNRALSRQSAAVWRGTPGAILFKTSPAKKKSPHITLTNKADNSPVGALNSMLYIQYQPPPKPTPHSTTAPVGSPLPRSVEPSVVPPDTPFRLELPAKQSLRTTCGIRRSLRGLEGRKEVWAISGGERRGALGCVNTDVKGEKIIARLPEEISEMLGRLFPRHAN